MSLCGSRGADFRDEPEHLRTPVVLTARRGGDQGSRGAGCPGILGQNAVRPTRAWPGGRRFPFALSRNKIRKGKAMNARGRHLIPLGLGWLICGACATFAQAPRAEVTGIITDS